MTEKKFTRKELKDQLLRLSVHVTQHPPRFSRVSYIHKIVDIATENAVKKGLIPKRDTSEQLHHYTASELAIVINELNIPFKLSHKMGRSYAAAGITYEVLQQILEIFSPGDVLPKRNAE